MQLNATTNDCSRGSWKQWRRKGSTIGMRSTIECTSLTLSYRTKRESSWLVTRKWNALSKFISNKSNDGQTQVQSAHSSKHFSFFCFFSCIHCVCVNVRLCTYLHIHWRTFGKLGHDICKGPKTSWISRTWRSLIISLRTSRKPCERRQLSYNKRKKKSGLIESWL